MSYGPKITVHCTWVAALLSLAACIGDPASDNGYIGGFNGGVIADEPRAALVGREVLATGGSAADAAIAAYFTMAVTLPNAAGLGGGGQCVIHSRSEERTEALVFLPLAPVAQSGGRASGRAVAVPANARGMFALHARYGAQPWADLLRPAESLAREGHPISRAFARRLQADGARLREDQTAGSLFFDDDGNPLTEGRVVRQLDLGALLSVLRFRGPGDFYEGQAGRQFIEAAVAAGIPMTQGDLRRTRPSFQPTIQVPLGDELLHFAPTGGGAVAAQLWALLDARDTNARERPHLFAEASRRARGAAGGDPRDMRAAVMPESLARVMAGYDPDRAGAVSGEPVPLPATGGAAIVTADNTGQSVACAFTMNRPFGTGKFVPGSGILLAEPTDAASQALAVAVLSNPVVHQLFFAIAAAGGPAAPVALVSVANAVLRDGAPADAAVAAPRLVAGTEPGNVVWAESATPSADLGGLRQRGHQVVPASALGRVAAIHCPGGLPRQQLCQFVSDPRGFGLAAVTVN